MRGEDRTNRARRFRWGLKKTGIIAVCASMSLGIYGCDLGKKGEYVHGKKGYYSQLDNGIKTEVRNQGAQGNCWAQSMVDAIRTSYQIKNGKDISITVDDIVKTHYSPDKTEGMRVVNAGQENNVGGDPVLAIWSLSNGCNGYTVVKSPVLFESRPGTAQDKFGADMDYSYDLASRDEIKNLIRTEGGVIALLNAATGYVQTHGYFTIYDDKFASEEQPVYPDGYFGHAAIVVGWDDNFPKDYFGAEYGRTPPKGDGAWLLKDSAGEKAGNGGYYWVSYYSAIRFATTISVSDKYKEVLHYDGGSAMGIKTGNETCVANVFHHKGQLAAVGTYIGVEPSLTQHNFGLCDNTRCVISIRDAEMKEEYARKDCTFDYEGYYVIELDTPLDVEDFSIVITYYGAAPVEGVDPAKLKEAEKVSSIEYITSSEEGQSFLLLNGQWRDLTDPSLVEELTLECPPNNCCIKALMS